MPIDYEYGDPRLAAFAAGQVGQALDQRAQEQLAFDRQLKLDQMGLEQGRLSESQRQFDIAKQLEQNMAALQEDRARQAMGLQFSRDRTTAATQQYNDWRDFQQQMALNQANRLGMMEQIGYQGQLQAGLNAQNAEMQWNMGAGEQANLNAKQALTDIQKMNLSPEGQQLRSQWRAKISSFQAKQGELRPQTYAAGMSELLDGMAKAGIEDFEVVDQTPEESIQQSVRPYDANNVLVRKADGSWAVNKLQPPPKEEADKPIDPGKEVIQTPYGNMTRKDYDTRFARDYESARQRVIARKKAENSKNITADDYNPHLEFDAQDKEIMDEVNRYNAARNAHLEGRTISEARPPKPPLSEIPVMDPAFAAKNKVKGWVKNQGKAYYMAESREDAAAVLNPGETAILPDGEILEAE